jgi:hypothetical protein
MAKIGLLKNITKYIPLKQNAGKAIITLLLLIILFSIFNNSSIEGNQNAFNPNAFNGKQKLEVIMWIDSSNVFAQFDPITDNFNKIATKYSGHALIVTETQSIEKSEAYLKTCTGGPYKFGGDVKKEYDTKWKNNAPVITLAVFDSTKGDTIAKGGVRSLAGVLGAEKEKKEVTVDYIEQMITFVMKIYSIYPKPKVS